jgi:hypothetical protein
MANKVFGVDAKDIARITRKAAEAGVTPAEYVRTTAADTAVESAVKLDSSVDKNVVRSRFLKEYDTECARINEEAK